MSKRNRTPASSTGGGRGRSVPITIDKPKPWGTILGSLVLVGLLAGIVAYAVLNQGAGFEDPLEKADASFGENLLVVPADDAEANHVEGPVEYPDGGPPASGNHSGSPAPCQVYTEAASTEGMLHSLEHGGVWITYRPDLSAEQVSTLTDDFGSRRNVAVSPYEGQTEPVAVTAWTRQITVDSPDDERIGQFLDAYAQGSQAPERSVGC